jgi:maleylpyruvate isomerase
MVDQYEGGAVGRSAEIERGAGRPFTVIQADLRNAATAMLTAFERVAPSEWSRPVGDSSGRDRVLVELPGRRWLEVEVHLVDLEIGVSHRDWSDAFVDRFLAEARVAA